MKTTLHAVALLLVVLLGSLAAGSSSSLPKPGGDSLPDSLGTLIYPTSSQLPPYPGENAALLDPARWTSSSETESTRCVLELCVYEHGVPVRLRSVLQRKPNQSLSARYLCVERGWREPHYAGPFYVWNQQNDLVERSWRSTDGSRYREDLYQYRDNGLIWAYRRRELGEDQTGPSLMISQYFDPSGALAGYSIQRVAVAGADTLAIRRIRGRDIAEESFRKWAGEFR